MKILTISCHPDDIEIAAGGTIRKYADRGDEVTVFGPDGWTAEDAAEAAGTISYEVLCAVSRRVPRYYIG